MFLKVIHGLCREGALQKVKINDVNTFAPCFFSKIKDNKKNYMQKVKQRAQFQSLKLFKTDF